MDVKRLAYLLTILIGLFAIAGVMYWYSASLQAPPPASGTLSDAESLDAWRDVFPPGAPPPQEKDYVTEQKGFSVLVSFTGSAFEPAELTVQRGERIRFTNNASVPLRITGSAAVLADLSEVSPGDYQEVAFTESGEWSYSDIATLVRGTVLVR